MEVQNCDFSDSFLATESAILRYNDRNYILSVQSWTSTLTVLNYIYWHQ